MINGDGSITVTFTNTTDIIYLRLEIPRATGVLGVRGVLFTQVSNPQTGDDSTWWEAVIQWFNGIFSK